MWWGLFPDQTHLNFVEGNALGIAITIFQSQSGRVYNGALGELPGSIALSITVKRVFGSWSGVEYRSNAEVAEPRRQSLEPYGLDATGSVTNGSARAFYGGRNEVSGARIMAVPVYHGYGDLILWEYRSVWCEKEEKRTLEIPNELSAQQTKTGTSTVRDINMNLAVKEDKRNRASSLASCTLAIPPTYTVNSLNIPVFPLCLAFPSCMECHLSIILAPFVVAPPRCGAANVRVLGTVQQNTSTTYIFLQNVQYLWWHWYSIFQDWPRHREECIPVMSPTSCCVVSIISTPPPAEPHFVNVSAILFSPEDGELTEIILTASDLLSSNTGTSASRKTENCYY